MGCVFDRGRICSILTNKECKDGGVCKFYRTKDENESSKRMADNLFEQHTGCKICNRDEYVKRHAPKGGVAMCDECHRSICPSGCPNCPDPIHINCDVCNQEIYDGDSYYLIYGSNVCEDCIIKKYRKTYNSEIEGIW